MVRSVSPFPIMRQKAILLGSLICWLKSLPNDKILAHSKLKALADNKINVTQKFQFVLGRVENILGKGKMLVTSIFSFSQNLFKSLLPQGQYCVVKSQGEK